MKEPRAIYIAERKVTKLVIITKISVMAEPLDNEVTRILSSETSKTLLTQLKSMTSHESKIEEELLLKTAQINKLQTYLRTEIDNIQGIVETNTRLQREKETLRRELDLKEAENRQLEEMMREN